MLRHEASLIPTHTVKWKFHPKAFPNLQIFKSFHLHQIHHQPISPRHTCRQFPKENQSGIDKITFTVFGYYQAAFVWFFAFVVHAQGTFVSGIDISGKVNSPFLYPAFKIFLCYFIRVVQNRVIGLLKIYFDIFISYSFAG